VEVQHFTNWKYKGKYIQNIPKEHTCISQDNSAETLDLAEKIPWAQSSEPILGIFRIVSMRKVRTKFEK
jgi:hypothetical protein